MKPTIHNAFKRDRSTGGAAGRTPRSSLAASLSPMQARLHEADFGGVLHLSPMSAVDALAAVCGRDDESVRNETDLASPESLILISSVSLASGEARLTHLSATELRDHARRLGLDVVEVFGEEVIVMRPADAVALVGMLETSRIRLVKVDGEVEASDAAAILRAFEDNASPLDAELRASAAMQVIDDRVVTLHARSRAIAERVIAQNFRHYVAALLDGPSLRYSPPPAWQIERLLNMSGILNVRPIETQVYSTFVDVGVSTTPESEAAPAQHMLIYDRPSDTWHSEN